MIKILSDLDIFNLSFRFAMDMFVLSKSFSKEERYSLTDQLIRSSRSISANIEEEWGKRNYEIEFKKHLVYDIESLEEAKAWILFAKECEYIPGEKYDSVCLMCDEIGAEIYELVQNWKS